LFKPFEAAISGSSTQTFAATAPPPGLPAGKGLQKSIYISVSGPVLILLSIHNRRECPESLLP
jgi:hypothetical protein